MIYEIIKTHGNVSWSQVVQAYVTLVSYLHKPTFCNFQTFIRNTKTIEMIFVIISYNNIMLNNLIIIRIKFERNQPKLFWFMQ